MEKDFLEEFVERFDNGEQFDEDELQELTYFAEVQEYGEPDRWTTPVQSIIPVGDRYFALNWVRGNTEYQDNEYFEQPYEVKPKEKVITVYVPMDEEE